MQHGLASPADVARLNALPSQGPPLGNLVLRITTRSDTADVEAEHLHDGRAACGPTRALASALQRSFDVADASVGHKRLGDRNARGSRTISLLYGTAAHGAVPSTPAPCATSVSWWSFCTVQSTPNAQLLPAHLCSATHSVTPQLSTPPHSLSPQATYAHMPHPSSSWRVWILIAIASRPRTSSMIGRYRLELERVGAIWGASGSSSPLPRNDERCHAEERLAESLCTPHTTGQAPLLNTIHINATRNRAHF